MRRSATSFNPRVSEMPQNAARRLTPQRGHPDTLAAMIDRATVAPPPEPEERTPTHATTARPVHVRIEAPDALRGFLLVQWVVGGRASVERRGESWEVSVVLPPGASDARAEPLLAVARRWLRAEGLAATTVHIDGRSFRLTP